MVYGLEFNSVNPLNGTDRPQYNDRFDEPVGYYHYGSWAGYLGARGYGGYAFLPEESGSLNTCEDLNLISDKMSNYGWGSEDYIGPDGTVWNARNTSYSDNFKYCNIDNSKYRTIRNGFDNGSIYVAGTTTLENGIEINADVHYLSLIHI